jgi:hypothetical protein
VGELKMRMNAEMDAGGTKVSFRPIDIREIDAETLLRSGCAGDLALAMLAKGGMKQLTGIARRAAALGDQARVRVLTQLVLLSGLQCAFNPCASGLPGRLKMEMATMGSVRMDIQQNEILRDVWEEVMAKGNAEGELAGMLMALRGQLHTKFSQVPKWAEARPEKANRAQIERWLNKIVIAQSLEGVIGKK